MNTHTVIIICIFLNLKIEKIESQKRVGYKEKCDRIFRCNSSANLICQNGTCECQMQDDMIYDSELKKCVAMVAGKCYIPFSQSFDDSSHEGRFLKYDCVKNAICNEELKECACENNYYETLEGFCSLKKIYNEPCNSSNECDEKAFLKCIDNICNCDPSISIFDLSPMSRAREENQYYRNYHGYDNSNRYIFSSSSASCAGIPGMACIGTKRLCVDGTKCHENTDICTCPAGSSATNGKCYLNYDQDCSIFDSTSFQCSPDKNCVNSKCKCKYGQFQYLSNEICTSFVRSPCSTNLDCTLNSECIMSDIGDYRECKCKKGWNEVKGFCEREFGENCRDMTEISLLNNKGVTQKFLEKCDSSKGLECINFKCDCPDESLIYNNKTRKCELKAGFICKSENFTSVNDCTENSSCFEEHEDIFICKCEIGYKATNERICVEEKILDTWQEKEVTEESFIDYRTS